MLKGIQEFFAKRRLDKIGKDRKSKVYNYLNSDAIGVVCTCESETQINLIQRYIQKLKEEHGIRKIKLLALCNEKELPAYLKESENIIGVTKKEFSFTGSSENGRFLDFVREKFHILLDFSRDVNPEVKFVVKSSQASFKVGRFANENLEMYDLMLNMEGSKDLNTFMDLLDKYLVMIDQKNN
ncbi:MAG: hypothetical protein R2799_04950 [Crocinitomicaceae bacterium]